LPLRHYAIIELPLLTLLAIDIIIDYFHIIATPLFIFYFHYIIDISRAAITP